VYFLTDFHERSTALTIVAGKLSDVTERTKDVLEAAAKESSSKVISAYLQAALLINSQVAF
jgi:hypothetical protein